MGAQSLGNFALWPCVMKPKIHGNQTQGHITKLWLAYVVNVHEAVCGTSTIAAVVSQISLFKTYIILMVSS